MTSSPSKSSIHLLTESFLVYHLCGPVSNKKFLTLIVLAKPPTSSHFSITRTFMFFLESSNPAARPANPAPNITTSNFLLFMSILEMIYCHTQPSLQTDFWHPIYTLSGTSYVKRRSLLFTHFDRTI